MQVLLPIEVTNLSVGLQVLVRSNRKMETTVDIESRFELEVWPCNK